MKQSTRLQQLGLSLGVCFVIGSAVEAHANGAEVGFDASTIFPLESRSIQLVSERVVIFLDDDLRPRGPTNAECVYVLRNLSDSTQTFAMAFMNSSAQSLELPEPGDDPYDEAVFQVEQDGEIREVEFRGARGDEFFKEYGTNQVSFPTWSLTIASKATSTVRMRYYASWSGGSDGLDAGLTFRYHARPAARWKNRIEHASITFHLGDTAFVRRLRRTNAPWDVQVSPAQYEWLPEGLRWEFKNWEPEKDLRISIMHPSYNVGGDPAWDPYTPDSLAAMPDLTMGLDRAPEPIPPQTCRDPRTGRPTAGWPPATGRLRILVGTEGDVQQVRYPKGPHDMGEFAEECVRTWRYRPAIKDGRAVPAWIDVSVHYPSRR